MVERNLCAEVDCSSSCCHNVWFYMIENPKDYFQDPKRAPDKATDEPLEKGVYFSVSGGQYKIIIIGSCPNLNDRNCSIYPNHPPGCKKIAINSMSCHQARKRDRTIDENTT